MSSKVDRRGDYPPVLSETLPLLSHASSHAPHANSAPADRSFAQATRNKARLGQVAGVFETELVVEVHGFVANGVTGNVDIPAEQMASLSRRPFSVSPLRAVVVKPPRFWI